jgi:hypothetical protein
MELVGPGARWPTLKFGPETSPLGHPPAIDRCQPEPNSNWSSERREPRARVGLTLLPASGVGHATRQLDRLRRVAAAYCDPARARLHRRAVRQGLAHRCGGLGLAVWALGCQATRQADEAVQLAPIYLCGKQEANNCLQVMLNLTSFAQLPPLGF